MAWTRIDDKFLLNPKVQTVGIHGMALYLSGLIYCNGNLTDGFIMDGVLPMLCGMAFQTPAKKVADKLVEVNLWERVDGGYQIHDFLSFNKSKKEIETINKTRATNGAKHKRFAKQTGTDLLSEQVPINPKPLLNTSTTTTTRDGEISEIAKIYESEIGALTGMIRDKLVMAIEEYPKDWIIKALEESASNNKRSWSYAEAILKRWKVDGFQADTRQKTFGNKKPSAGHIRQIDKKDEWGYIPGYVSDTSNEEVVYDD